MPPSPRRTAQLGEALRSALAGYAVSLVPHPAVAAPPGPVARVVRIAIAEPHMEAVVWVDDEQPSIEVRVVVYVGSYGAAPAAMAGDSVAFFDDDFPVDDTLGMIARLIDDELLAQCADDDATREAMQAGRAVYLNDWPA